MTLQDLIDSLHGKVSKESRIVTDQQDAEFKASLERWSNLDLKVPGAIIRPANEKDAILTVRSLCNNLLPIRCLDDTFFNLTSWLNNRSKKQ